MKKETKSWRGKFLERIKSLRGQKLKLPMRIPKYAACVDYGDPKPGRNAYNKACGVFHLGNDQDEHELWLNAYDMKTHALVTGTTGSGKTAALESIACNAFTMGTGLCYIDPKGDPKLAHELFIMARRVNREDDFLALDFMTGGKKSENQTPFRMSNTTNPFATAPADAITNLLTSLLPRDDGGGNSVFQQKATALLTALIPVLCALRDAKQALPLTGSMEKAMGNSYWAQRKLGSNLSISTLRDYLDPLACVGLVYPLGKGERHENSADPVTPEWEECDAVAKFVDKPLLDVLKAALSSLNYVPGKGEVKNQQAYLDQFGYARGYFGYPLASISGMYGHLFNVSSGEIDMYDCLFNRRILCSILPFLEKSPQECENLGKIVLAEVKNSVAGGLGDKLEGATKEVMAARPASSRTPGIIIVDEYPAIMMPGFEVILTQARSLGFMTIIASQDGARIKAKDSRSGSQIIENTALKLFMKAAAGDGSWELFRKLRGPANEIRVEECDLSRPEEKGRIRTVETVSEQDLLEQKEGEFHALWHGDVIRGSVPYLIPKVEPHHHFRVNRFLRISASPEHIRRNIDKWRLDGRKTLQGE